MTARMEFLHNLTPITSIIPETDIARGHFYFFADNQTILYSVLSIDNENRFPLGLQTILLVAYSSVMSIL